MPTVPNNPTPLLQTARRPVVITILGIGLCIGGVLGFLPIVGFWMLHLGILVLSVEYHPIRRFRRRFEVWWGRRRKASVTKRR